MSLTSELGVTEAKQSNLTSWLVCFSASLFFFYEFIQGNMFASIADNIMRDFHIHADKMAYLSSIYYGANVIFLFLAGYLLDRYSTKKIILVAMTLCVASTFILAHTDSFAWALVCRFITGIGSAFCFLGPVRLASRWFPSHKMAMVTGIIVTIAMTGGMVSQYPLTQLVAYEGWRMALQHVGLLGVVMLGIMYMGIAERASTYKGCASEHSFKKIAKQSYGNVKTLRAAAYTSLMNMAIAVFGAMMGSLYLMQRLNIGKEDASLCNMMLFSGCIFGGPIIGWISDRWGRRILPMQISATLALVTLLVILYLPVSLGWMQICFFLLGFLTAGQVISYAYVAESNSPLFTATAVSAISICTQGGYVIYQNLFSHLLVSYGDAPLVNGVPVYALSAYQYAAGMLPLGIFFAIVLISGLKETYCHAMKE
ncbi:MAG: MFS transporter [Legionellaceae bacterium]|nr:MFS transporter [Legionellaceae bacterium]